VRVEHGLTALPSVRGCRVNVKVPEEADAEGLTISKPLVSSRVTERDEDE
jgi:hypothetical protein